MTVGSPHIPTLPGSEEVVDVAARKGLPGRDTLNETRSETI